MLAARLSEDPRVSVVVLEAAPAHLEDPVRRTLLCLPLVANSNGCPADTMGWTKQMMNSEYDWMYWSTEQPQLPAREKEPFLFPRYVFSSILTYSLTNLLCTEDVALVVRLP